MNYDYKISASGRVNIIGDHIDYCGGKVLPFALSMKNIVYIKANNTNKINIIFTTTDFKASLDINKLEEYKNLKYVNYQAGCAYVWKNSGHKLIGCDILSDCHVPFGSGLSSSAAIEVSTLVALATIANDKIDKREIAILAQKAEREFANVNCGIMDQYASANGKKNCAMLLDCKKIEHENVMFNLGEYKLIITNCNKPHNLGDSKYNERRCETEEALNILRKNCNIECLADLSLDDFNRYKHLLNGKIKDRCEHVVNECNRVNEAVKALKNNDIIKLGKLLNESHYSLRDLYEVSCIELDTLQDLAISFDGCIGSRMTGGGFGGCTISIVKSNKVNDFKNYISENYKEKIGYLPSFYESDIDDGITISCIK